MVWILQLDSFVDNDIYTIDNSVSVCTRLLSTIQQLLWQIYPGGHTVAASAKNISVQAEWLRQSGHAPSAPSETLRWRITLHPASIPRVALHIALRSLFHHFFLLRRCPILNKRSGIVANCDNTSEWVHWVRACIGVAMRWVMLRKSFLALLLPGRKMQYSLY
jgi:hypothetical protein